MAEKKRNAPIEVEITDPKRWEGHGKGTQLCLDSMTAKKLIKEGRAKAVATKP